MFANWEEVFESFSEIEKDEIRAQENISDEKICADVENYFEKYVGDSTANCYGEEVPDVVDEQWIYSRENFLWALSQKARVLQELKILLNSNEIKNVLIGRIKAYNNKGVCFVSYTPFLFSDDGERHFIDINNNIHYKPKMLFLSQDSLNSLHEPDYTRKDAFLIGTTLYIYGKPYNRTMYDDDEYGSASAEVINVTAICTLTDTEVETKNIKTPDIFYFLDASTIKQTITIFIK